MDSTSTDSSSLCGHETYAVVTTTDFKIIVTEETGKKIEAWLVAPASGPAATLRAYDLYGDAFLIMRARMGGVYWSTREGRRNSSQHCQILEDLDIADRKEVATYDS